MRLLDTNVLIGIRDDDRAAIARYAAIEGPIAMSIISRIELENGIHRDPAEAIARRIALDALLEDMDVVPFDTPHAARYRAIIEAVGYARTRTLDRMIAATALETGATVVTANVRDFRDVPGLEIEDWSN